LSDRQMELVPVKSLFAIVTNSIDLLISMWNFLDNFSATNYMSYLVKMSDRSFFFRSIMYFVLSLNVSYLPAGWYVSSVVDKSWCFCLCKFFCIGQVGPVSQGHNS
jgi:hypothetical protein